MLELRPQREKQVLPQQDLVLDETAEQIVIEPGRDKRQRRRIAHHIVREPIAQAPYHLMTRAQTKVMLEIQVIRVEGILENARRREAVGRLGKRQMRMVVVRLQTHIGLIRIRMRPAPQHVAAAQTGVFSRDQVFVAVVEIPLQGQRVLRGRIRIDAEPALDHVPRVRCISAVAEHRVIAIEILAVDAVVHVRAQRTAVTRPCEILQLRSAARFHGQSLRLAGVASGDIDHTVDRIRSPQRSAGSADHFDAIDVFERIILRVPDNARIQRRVNRPAVDQDQQFVG